MKQNNRFDGSSDPFQGDHILRLQSIPAGARIRYATATITPRGASGAEQFIETIDFAGSSTTPPIKWGATISTGQVSSGAAGTKSWAEVDFHARRTLAKVVGSNFTNSQLQADFGGLYVEINDVGGIKTPNGNNNNFSIGASPSDLPGLTVTKFKLTNSSAQSPQISSVKIRSVPTNISMRFGQMPVFWTRVGEMTEAETTPDFTLALQAFLSDNDPENGVYNVPLIIHSDAIARLQIDLNIEFIMEENALSSVNSISLPFDFGSASNVATQMLQIALPMNTKLSPRASRARVTGNFAETRIIYNPMEKVTAQAGSPVGLVKSAAPAGKARIAPNSTQAQPISFDNEVSATAIDLLLEVKETARLRLDLREDFDGKPGPSSLLPKVVDFDVPGPAGLENSAESVIKSKWISITLPVEFRFKASVAGTRKRYWIIVQSVEGEAQWSVATVADAPNTSEPVGLQRSTEDGLSWREAAAPNLPGPLIAFFRLRRISEFFQMPVALQIGEGNEGVRVSLDRFAPRGSVDFDLDFDDLNKGLVEYMKRRPLACREASYLLNGDFKQWIDLKQGPNTQPNSTDQPAEWTVTEGIVKQGVDTASQKTVAMLGRAILPSSTFEAIQTALSQVTPVIGSCTYDFSFEGVAFGEDAIAEIFWRGETCGAVTPEPVRVPIKQIVIDTDGVTDFNNDSLTLLATGQKLFFHRVRVTAPPTARQAEVRFSVPDGTEASITDVSLRSTMDAVANGDFRVKADNKFEGWTPIPNAPLPISEVPQSKMIKLDNVINLTNSIEIKQTVEIKPDQLFALTISKGQTVAPKTQTDLPRVEVRWLRADSSETESPVVINIDPTSFGSLLATGTSPSDAAYADIHIIIPPKTSQEIESISLRFLPRTIIPITFVAQAPGELTISGWQIGFEDEPGTRPPIPPKGLCLPTPIGQQPGEPGHDSCFCKCCGSRQPVAKAKMMKTEKGTPVLVAECASCGDQVISFGGSLDAGATNLLRQSIVEPQPILIVEHDLKANEADTSPSDITKPESITNIKGIGKQLSEQLAGLGITSVEDLATSSPEMLTQVKGISEALAVQFIAQAQALLNSEQQ